VRASEKLVLSTTRNTCRVVASKLSFDLSLSVQLARAQTDKAVGTVMRSVLLSTLCIMTKTKQN
jgi:hypothetical protein